MSLFGQSSAGGAGSGSATGGSSLFSGLNLDTSVGADPSAKRKSVFEPSSTTQARSQSMFGLGSTPASSGTSLFGQTATTTSAPSGGLFGAAPSTTTTSAPSTGLFGAAPASTAGAGGGLFGGQTASSAQPASGGLLGVPASTPAQGGGLFGRPSTATATTSAPSTGLFGASAASRPANLFSLGQPATTSSNPAGTGGGLFGTSSAQPVLGASTAAQSTSGPSQTEKREPAYFSSLLERQKKKARLNNVDQGNQLGQLPSVNMDLGDLARRAQELGNRSQKIGQSPARDSRAHYLLSGSGVAPGKAYREFQDLDRDSFTTTAPPRIDFAEEGSAYLRGLQTKGREAMLRESMDRVYQEVDDFIAQSLGIDFEEQKQRIMEHFGLVSKEEGSGPADSTRGSFGNTRALQKSEQKTRSVFGRSAMEKSMIGNASSMAGTTSFFANSQSSSLPVSLGKYQTVRDLRDKERLFLEKVEILNKARLNVKTYPLLREFASVESATNRDSPKQLLDVYVALQEITGENASEAGIEERLYAKKHMAAPGSSESAEIKKRILDKSRSYLERAFYKDLETIVEKNPRAAQVGGMPTVINKVRGYIRVRAERHDLAPDGAELQQIGDSGDYCWILIFYLLRSGFVKEAAEYVNNDAAFQSTDRRFVSYLTSYANSPDRRLGRKLQEMIDGEYQQRQKIAPKGTVDPYRMACYKVIGRCELSQRNLDSVGQGVEDWLWLQFTLARENERFEELSNEIFGLDQICETVLEIGQKHFQKSQVEGSNAYGTYFLMQILAGMFEQAVDYLHAFNPVSAVHLAIALDYYGLLRVSDYRVAGNDLLTETTTQQWAINFVPLVAHYTGTFRAALPIAAVDYLALLCLNSDLEPTAIGQIHTQACHECLRELCLETREFAALLGDIRGDGSRLPGAIERRAKLIRLESHDAFLRSITSQSAAIADQRGQTADAVLLYHLCDDYDNVTAVLNRALADAIAVDLGDAPMSLQPLRPRQTQSSGSTEGSQTEAANSSLSLTQSTSSPAELASNMMGLYDSNASYFSRITLSNRQSCKILLRMLSARAKIENPVNPEYLQALEELNSLGIIPLETRGNIPEIRSMASSFGALPQVVARCAGLVILWCVKAIGGERERLSREGAWSAGSEDDLHALKTQLSQMAKDLMVFAGLVKYKLPGRVYDLLTRAGGEVGAY